MRSLAREVADLMEANGIGIINDAANRNLFVGELPYNEIDGIFLIPTQGPPPHQYVDTEYPIIDVWVRHPKTPLAWETMAKVQSTLHRRHHYQIGDWYVYFSQALGSIIDIDRDIEGGKLLRLSLQFICRNLNNVS